MNAYHEFEDHARAVRRDHDGRTSRGLSVEIARHCVDNPLPGDDPSELLSDLKQCAAACIGAGCEPLVRPLPGQSLGVCLAAPDQVDLAGGTLIPLPPLFRAPVGVWVHFHTKRYFTLFKTCAVPTRQGVLTGERRA